MFSGIIQDRGKVQELAKKASSLVLTIKTSLPKNRLRVGESVAVNGVCLTVESLNGDLARFTVVEESLAKSNLGALMEGDEVNLEAALLMSDALSGHFVSGHVDCFVELLEINEFLKIKIPENFLKLTPVKGSICIDGVSLTIANLEGDVLTCALIPETLKATTLGVKSAGDKVNVEFDLIARYLNHLQQ